MRDLPEWFDTDPHDFIQHYERARAAADRYRRMALIIIVAWLLSAGIAFYRDYQQREAYRLLEFQYTIDTNKPPPKLKP